MEETYKIHVGQWNWEVLYPIYLFLVHATQKFQIHDPCIPVPKKKSLMKTSELLYIRADCYCSSDPNQFQLSNQQELTSIQSHQRVIIYPTLLLSNEL